MPMHFVMDTGLPSQAQFVVGAPRRTDLLSKTLTTAYLPEPDYPTEIERLLRALDKVADVPGRPAVRISGRD